MAPAPVARACARARVVNASSPSDTYVNFLGFLGAWLLVAGPLYQGSIELREQQIDRAGFEAAAQTVPFPARPSQWWWILPPVMLALRRRRTSIYWRRVRASLTPEQQIEFTRLTRKAAGWFTVSGGAFLIALKETWELSETLELHFFGFLIGLVLMLILAIGGAKVSARSRRGSPAAD
jgi:hypothetical protein